jgi:hypothetical protein
MHSILPCFHRRYLIYRLWVFTLAAFYIELTVPDTTLKLPGLELPDGI